MTKNKRFVSILVCITALLTIQAMAQPIVSVDSPDDLGYGCLVIYNGQGYRVGWTQSDAYAAVVISAKLASGGAASQIGRAYLTTQIGSGTSTNAEIASTSFTFPLAVTNVVLFQGLHLPPGSYYLSIIGDSSSWGSCWKIGWATNVITGADVLSLGGFGAVEGLAGYFPATPAYPDLTIPPEFAVQGDNVNHPVLHIAHNDNNVLISWSTNAVGFDLESASSLPSPGWQVISQALVTNSGRFVFTTNANSSQFFRLTKKSN